MTVFEFFIMLLLSISSLFASVYFLRKITANNGHVNKRK